MTLDPSTVNVIVPSIQGHVVCQLDELFARVLDADPDATLDDVLTEAAFGTLDDLDRGARRVIALNETGDVDAYHRPLRP